MSKNATVITLGCAKNTVDSEHIKGSLAKSGLVLTEDPVLADYIVINTCGFIEAAKQESINTILELIELKNQSPDKKVVVTGCLAQRYLSELSKEIPEIDMLVDLKNEFSIGEMLAREQSGNGNGNAKGEQPAGTAGASLSEADRVFSTYPARVLSGLPYAYLQIADGCDNRCSYCAIPLIRGAYRSKPIEQIIEEAHWLDEQGIKEINIIAQDTSRYGYDLYGRSMLTELVDRLVDFNNVAWLRLLYLQPYFLNDDLISALKRNPYLLPYIDIPFQHASPKILRAMNRHGAGSDFLAQIAWLRRMVPELVIRTSVIVGFPGESEDDFAELVEFIKQADFDYLGVFIYSAEEGTKAAELKGRVPEDVIDERYHQLVALQDLISQRRNETRLDQTFDVLIEKEVDAAGRLFEGRAWWQAPEVDGYTYVRGKCKPGQIIKATVDEFDGCDFHGRVSGPGK